MNGAQILLGSVILFIIYKTFISYKQNKLNIRFTFVWIIFWCLSLFIIIDQTIAITVANIIGIKRGSDLVIYLSIIIIYFLMYIVFVRLNDIEKKITRKIRKDSIKKALKNKF